MPKIRGGATNSNHDFEEKEEEEEEEEDLDEDSDDDEYDQDGTSLASAFQRIDLRSNVAVRWLQDIVYKTPPITRFYLSFSIAITLLSYFFNNNNWPKSLTFDLVSFLFRFHWWKFFTGFLFIGQLDLFYPLTVQFVWQHMSQLEKLSIKQPDQFFTMLVFGAGTLVLLYSFAGISTMFLGHNLATYLVYIWSREFEGMDVNFMDICTLKSESLPWFFCLQSLLLEQEIPIADLIGIVVGHLYWYLKQKKRIRAPMALQDFFARKEIKSLYASFRSEEDIPEPPAQ
jgi:Derlin-2/3